MGSRRIGRTSLVLACVLALAATGADYRGCSCAPRVDDGVELPESTLEGCVVDADCGTDGCFVLGCVIGECMPVGPVTDVDGDGFGPSPCGEDCNDEHPGIHPGQAELCDGVDDDCDTIIDDGANGVMRYDLADGLVQTKIVGLADSFVVLGHTVDGQLAGYTLGTNGSWGAPAVVLSGPTALVRFDAAGEGTRIVIAYALEARALQRLILRQNSDGTLVPEGPSSPVGSSGEITGIAVHRFGGQDWIAYDEVETTEGRVLWRSGDGSSTPLSAEGDPALSDDGTLLAVTDGMQELDFFAQDGTPAGMQVLPGAFAAGPLAAGADVVHAVYHDAFDHSLTSVTPTSTRAPTSAPFGDPTDAVAVWSVPDGVIVTRTSASQLSAWLLAEDFGTYIATFEPSLLSGAATGPLRVSAASTGAGFSAILSSYDGTSYAAFLACSTAP